MVWKAAQKIKDSSWIAHLMAISGWAVYFIQAWIYAHIQTSFRDEGGYLYIGDLYARGIFRPFQDYGPARQYAPLAYLIPGQIEAWFGSSLQTGRFFSIFCGLMMVIAVWIIAQRLGGKWIGAAVVWALALTPISIQIYSLAITQALVASLLAWSMLFVLGNKRSLWQIVTGSLLAGIMVMTRQNLIPVIPILIAYVFWQHGKKAGFWALIGCMLPILVIHIIYWPNILQIWATWLPINLTPFLDPFRLPTVAGDSVGPITSFSSRLLAFLQGIRFHFFTTIGVIVCLFLWPRRNEWSSQSNRRSAWFLSTLFLVLAVIHAWESFIITEPYCTSCFTPYLAFFDIIVFFLIAVSISSWRKQISRIKHVAIILFIIIVSTGLGYATFERFGPWLLSIKFPAFTRGLNPHKWVPFITIWDILANKFHQDYWTSRVYISAAMGLVLGVILLITGYYIFKITFKRIRQVRSFSYGSWILISFLGLGVVLSPLMGGIYRADEICSSNNLQSFENIGSTINKLIPAGSQVYWDVSNAVPLLYAPEINIYYPQIYGKSFLIEGGNAEQILKLGLWNEILAIKWWNEARYIVLENHAQPVYRPENFDPSQFNIFKTAPLDPCNPLSYLVIYQKKP
ncbi:MAG: glycosyltransferase family 39 protein [Anaerolineales bacterium]